MPKPSKRCIAMHLYSTASATFDVSGVAVEITSKDPRKDKDQGGRIYLTWQPVKVTARLVNGAGKVSVIIRNAGVAGGGKVMFGTHRDDTDWKEEVEQSLDGTPFEFWIAAKTESIDDGDAVIEAVAGGSVLASIPMMVRIRKNAQNLQPRERDRFVRAMAILNLAGAIAFTQQQRKDFLKKLGVSDLTGISNFTSFRDTHVSETDREMHGDAGFLPWHRAFLIDLERELQVIDPSVAIPYWPFDAAAPDLFTLDFIGIATSSGSTVKFSPENPLQYWRTDVGNDAILRDPLWDTSKAAPAGVLDQADTLKIGPTFGTFRPMEWNPHGAAHVSFIGYLDDPSTAPKDPLFFLLHANVDRLWANWQRLNSRTNPADVDTFGLGRLDPASSVEPSIDAGRAGHNRTDQMWPWNVSDPRPRPQFIPPPSRSPRGTLARSPITTAPGDSPTVGDLIDYQAITSGSVSLGFDYDDLRFPTGPQK
jgi:tyrosinase